MAMEINAKGLHKHALLVTFVLLSFMIVSTFIVANYSQGGFETKTRIVRAAFTRTVDIEPRTNGFVSVKIHDDYDAHNRVGQAGKVADQDFDWLAPPAIK